MTAIEFGQRVRFTWTLTRRSRYRYPDGTAGRMEHWKVWEHITYPGQRMPEPRDGIVVGVRTLANGRNEYGSDEPIHFAPTERFTAYLVATDLRHKPVLVLPQHLEVTA